MYNHFSTCQNQQAGLRFEFHLGFASKTRNCDLYPFGNVRLNEIFWNFRLAQSQVALLSPRNGSRIFRSHMLLWHGIHHYVHTDHQLVMCPLEQDSDVILRWACSTWRQMTCRLMSPQCRLLLCYKKPLSAHAKMEHVASVQSLSKLHFFVKCQFSQHFSTIIRNEFHLSSS